MDADLVVKFLEALGTPNASVGHRWVMAPCPLAPFTHQKGTDNRPSFGVSLESGLFNCFSCTSGSLTKLVGLLESYVAQSPYGEQLLAKYQFKEARTILAGIDAGLEVLPDFESTAKGDPPFEEWPSWSLAQFVGWKDSPRASWYLTYGRPENGSQPVSSQVANDFGLMYDPTWDRLVAPFWTFSGKLAGARGRAVGPEAKWQHYDYTVGDVNNTHAVWYNERALETAAVSHSPVIVVEGQFDCMNVARVYPHVVAGLTAKSSYTKVMKLTACDGVLLMLDNDNTGMQAIARYQQFLMGRVPLGVVGYPEKDPAKLTEEQLREVIKEIL